MATQKEQKITITASSGLTKDEIERMTRDAESHAEEDRRYRDEVDAKNKADNLIYTTEKLLRENREKIPDSDAKAIESAIAECRKAVEEGGADKINKAIEGLTRATHRVADVLYKQAGAHAGSTTGSGGQASSTDSSSKPAEGEVIDAEYVDVDEKKK